MIACEIGSMARALCNAKFSSDAIPQGPKGSKAHLTGTVNCNNL
jgi:hypothetical protein